MVAPQEEVTIPMHFQFTETATGAPIVDGDLKAFESALAERGMTVEDLVDAAKAKKVFGSITFRTGDVFVWYPRPRDVVKTIAITAATTDAEIAGLHFDVRDLATEWRDYAVHQALGDSSVMTVADVDGIVVTYDSVDGYAFAAPGPSDEVVELYGKISSIEDAIRVAQKTFA